MRCIRQCVGLALAVLGAASLVAGIARAQDSKQSLCLMLESAARANDLPLPFLARVIWRESRFDPNAVGPITRSGARAQGIAQFMPYTAAERGLIDPFDPVQALPQAASFLRRLRDEFGNLGLAAAAYNAGPARVQGWLSGGRSIPGETRAYVQAITGRSIDDWAKAGSVELVVPKQECAELVTSLRGGGHGFFYELQKRVETALAKPWGVALAAGFSRQHVLDLYAHLMDKLSSLIGPHDPVVASSILRSRGTQPFYQARIGADTRAAADKLCREIRTAGAACIVVHTASR
jgi:hypothetical protein